MVTVETAYDACASLVKRSGSSFYWGMRLLPPPKRSAVFAVYAWCRLCDDAVDEHAGAEAEAHLQEAEAVAAAAFHPAAPPLLHPIASALADAVRRYRLPWEPFRDLLAGMRTDLGPVRFQTFEEVRRYCEQVAGTVGRMLVEIFGYRDAAVPDLAVDMGVALQLTNILRDLREDVMRGRLYVAQEDLDRVGLCGETILEAPSPAFDRLMALELARAEHYYTRAVRLIALLEPDARAAAAVLYGVYYALWRQIRANPRAVLSQRVSLPIVRKFGLIGRALWQVRRL
jgi:phytoene synthase